MWNRLLAVLLLIPAVASAQTVAADRIRLNTGPCVERSGSGTPEGAVTGAVCDSFHRTDTGALYLKASGSGNTGWQQIGLTIDTPGASNLTIAPAGDLILGPVGLDILPNAPYAQNLGALTNKYLTLHAAELWVETLVAQNTIATIGGRILVAPTNILTNDLPAASTNMLVRYNNFNTGDRIYMEANGSVEFMAVTGTGICGLCSGFAYSVTRNLDGSGANNWAAGDAIVDTGTTGNGFIDVYSTAGVLSVGAGPTIVGNVRTGTAYNAYSPRWAIGNLNGLYGYASSIYGAVFGDPSNTNVTVDATNGFRIRSATTNKFLADTSGNLSIVGDLTVGTAGTVHSAAATAYGTGIGFWLAGGSTPVFRVGDPAGAGLSWDGTTLSIRSSAAAGGKNQIRNSECRVGTEDWTLGANSTGLTPVFGSSLASWMLNNVSGTCYLNYSGLTPAATTTTNVNLSQFTRLPVVAGSRYEASAYIGLHRATQARVQIRWFDTGGTQISTISGTACTTASAGGTDLSGYCRSTLVASAPAGAVTARFQIETTYVGGGGGNDPYTFWTRAYFGEAWPYQTDASEWGPGGTTEITGGTIKTGSINADRITANTITAGQIAAGTITATQIAANTITAAQIAANTITAGQIAANTITAGQIAAGTITATQLAVSYIAVGDAAADINGNATTISGGKITTGSITATQIAANTITASQIAAGSITATELSVGSLSAISGDLGTITAGSINIGSGNFQVSTIGLTQIDSLSVSGLSVSTLFNLLNLAGGGNRVVCVNNSGLVFQGASSTAC